MAKQKNLDTSVEITYPNGRKETYVSLEDASLASELSEAAIKIRCNKSRNGSANKKDKIHCRWINDTTFRSYQAKKSRNKGGALETEVVNKLKEIGYTGVCRSAAESKKLDNNKIDIADVNNELPYAIQCKATQNLPNYYTIRENCSDPRDLIMIWKKTAEENSISKGTLAIIPVELLYYFLQATKK